MSDLTTTPLPCITLIQPWASFIAWGWKTIETRTHDRFRNLVSQRIGIHAGKSWDHIARAVAAPYLRPDQMQKYNDIHFRDEFPFGAIIATAWVQSSRKLYPQDSPAALFNISGPGRYGIFLTDIRPIVPVKISGKQGIWYYNGPIEVMA